MEEEDILGQWGGRGKGAFTPVEMACQYSHWETTAGLLLGFSTLV